MAQNVSFRCDRCGEQFKSERDMKQHEKQCQGTQARTGEAGGKTRGAGGGQTRQS